MNRRDLKKIAVDQLMNFIIIFLSYVLAAIIRFYIFRPAQAIEPFSLPFLIILLIYSALMAISLDYEETPRVLQGNEIYSGIYQIITKNAIGCLVLASVFFVTGIMNFSRWALFLFWIFSSVGLIAKRVYMYSTTSQNRCSGKDVWNVAIVGEGKLAEDYIKAITNNPQFGIRIIGYYGLDDILQTNLEGWFEPEKYPFPKIQWLGQYDIEKIKEYKEIDEIVVAESEETCNAEIMRQLLPTGRKVSIALPYSRFISHGTISQDLGATKVIEAGEKTGRKEYSRTGLVVSFAMLLVILMIKRFDLSSMDPVYTMAGIEKIRSVLFAVFGYSLFWILSEKLGSTKRGLVKSAVITLVCCTAFIMLYELVFPAKYWSSVFVDLVPTVIVVGIFFGIKEIVKVFSQSYVGN